MEDVFFGIKVDKLFHLILVFLFVENGSKKEHSYKDKIGLFLVFVRYYKVMICKEHVREKRQD